MLLQYRKPFWADNYQHRAAGSNGLVNLLSEVLARSYIFYVHKDALFAQQCSEVIAKATVEVAKFLTAVTDEDV